ncbi:hypothetical protein [Jiella avicenniae]|uniref:Uncharacterized protein n=1 Tax=Jiella avicenniae TaxID=2907202 RepID=A0A9X1T622_9HYPH|nr:hypothetical protein [Jiella avicenniae]MCE7029439.1 hypothetical protein [Jiella avicenniae]
MLPTPRSSVALPTSLGEALGALSDHGPGGGPFAAGDRLDGHRDPASPVGREAKPPDLPRSARRDVVPVEADVADMGRRHADDLQPTDEIA